MSWGVRASILIGVLLGMAIAAILPSRVFSGQIADGDLRVFYDSVRLGQDALTSGEILSRRVKSFAYSAFNGHVSSASDETQLDQFLATVRGQAIHEHWTSLVVDVWVGGKSSPAGYFFRYEGTDSRGAPVHGGAFITTDRAFVKANLDEHRALSRVLATPSK